VGLDETEKLSVSSQLSAYFTIWSAWAVVALALVPYLLLRPAPYGRHGRPGFGPVVSAKLAWVIMEAPSPLGMISLFVLHHRWGDAVALVSLGLWLFHYAYRSVVFPLLLPEASRPMPAAVLASGAFFNVVNAYLNGRWLFFLAPPRSITWLLSPRFVVGVSLFFGGFAMHVLADRALRRLRTAWKGAYAVPRGPLFRFVSCPNYLGEIVEWSGFALATWSPGGLIFAVWTAANLLPRAIRHHRWYREKFADYPRSRRAVVPFVL
jgi:3-oxo-5-alpha-steroid 4-dehydrogenase 1